MAGILTIKYLMDENVIPAYGQEIDSPFQPPSAEYSMEPLKGILLLIMLTIGHSFADICATYTAFRTSCKSFSGQCSRSL